MKPRHYVLREKQAVPVPEHDFIKWAKEFDICNRRVAEDHVGDIRISTVFLGLDHGFYEKEPPVLFETMVFGGALDDYCARYATWEQAEQGHRETVEKVKASLN